MQGLIARGDAPTGATVPNELSSERLWDLDVDDDLWTDLTRDGQYEDDAPRWLFDGPMKQGIRAMLDLQRSEEEIERLEHERGVMYAWLRGQEGQLQLAIHSAQGTLIQLFFLLVILIRPTTRQHPPPLPDRTPQRQPHSCQSGLEHEHQCRHW